MISDEYFEHASKVVNGFFYSFEYYPRNTKRLYDKTPFLYCIGPLENAVNKFVGLNLHHLPFTDRCKLIKMMQMQYHFMDDDTQHIISQQSLNNLVPGVLFSWRIYNMQCVYKLIRIKNAAVPLFLHEQGNIYLSTPDEKVLVYLLNSGLYKSSTYVR